MNLEVIDLSFNHIVGLIPPEILLLPKLVDLVMWANNLSGEIPDKFCSNGAALETLVISYNNFVGSIPRSISKCVNLIWVSLAGNHLTGSVPPSLGNLRKLSILQLNKNSLSGPIPEELGNCNSLIWLDLNSNSLTGTIPPQLAAQSGLVSEGIVFGKQFAFLGNQAGVICPGAAALFEFLDIRPERLAQFPTVHMCPGTRIYTGKTLYSFNNNGTIIFLDLSNNRLSGAIPAGLGRMMYLNVLHLSNNELDGPIPDTFAGLVLLGELGLSQNHLTGAIPPGLGGLSFLTIMDVSNNNLTGAIPTSGQLATFPASSYENNSGLCGITLLRPCGQIENRGGEPQDFPEEQMPLVSPSGLSIGLAFGVPVGFGLGILLLL